jgi:hypothetical protein
MTARYADHKLTSTGLLTLSAMYEGAILTVTDFDKYALNGHKLQQRTVKKLIRCNFIRAKRGTDEYEITDIGRYQIEWRKERNRI